MAIDLILAALHHILVFGLIGLLVAEGVLVRGAPTTPQIERIARLDRAYGGTAVTVIVVGVLRVVFGAKGYEYYVGNVWFWAKMASFAAVAVLSIWPTRQILVWRRAVAAQPSFTPAAAEVGRVLGFIRGESVFVVLILVFAAAMARFG
jgi:putative membrane protein